MMSQQNFRRMSFKTFQRGGMQDARQKLIRGRIQDARQILNKKAQNQNTGFVNPRFQKLANKQNQFRVKNRIGIIGKAKNSGNILNLNRTLNLNRNQNVNRNLNVRRTLNVNRSLSLNRNAYISKGKQQQNISQSLRVKLKNELIQRKQALTQGKQIKLRGGSIQITAKQPYQAAPVHIMAQDPNDELEEMTISDLQAYTQLQLPSVPARDIVSTIPPPPPTILTSPPVAMASSSHTILVSNLHPSVTEDDIKELFSAVGTINSTRFLHPGAALVAYYSKDDAVNACESYHNRLLDSQPMQCSLLSQSDRHQTSRTSIASRLGGRLASQNSSSHNFARVALSQYMPSAASQSGFAMRNLDPIFNVRLS